MCYLSPQSVVLLWQPKRTNSIPLSHSPRRDSPPVPVSAAAAKSLQLCPTLCDPIDVPGILQARTLEWVAISFSNAWKWKVKVKSLSHVWPSATPWTAAFQAPPSMGFSRQGYWSRVPLPSPSIYSKAVKMRNNDLEIQKKNAVRCYYLWASHCNSFSQYVIKFFIMGKLYWPQQSGRHISP